MLVMQACDTPSPKQPLGQHQEVIAAAWRHTSAGNGHEPGTDVYADLKLASRRAGGTAANASKQASGCL